MPEKTPAIPEVEPSEIDTLKAKVAEQEEIIRQQGEQIGQYTEKILSLQQSSAKVQESTPSVKPELSVKGKKWRFKFAVFVFEGKKVIAEDAALDKELIQKILETENQGILIPIF